MANERKTEELVRNLLREQGYYDDKNIIVEEQQSDSSKVNTLLKPASKSGRGKGYPEFIVRFVNEPTKIIVIECKASTKDHKSKSKAKRDANKYAVDGALHYAEYLKDQFDVIAIGVSGETAREVKISNFLWLKTRETYKDVTDKSLLDSKSLFKIVNKQAEPLKEEELIKKAIEYNDRLHELSIPEVDRCTVISSILVALQDKGFQHSYNSYEFDENEIDDDKPKYNPNTDLIEALISACKTTLKKNSITDRKQEVILREYEKIKSNHVFSNRVIQEKKKEVQNTVLRDLIDDVMENIMPYITHNIYDVLGKFYTQFIRYAGSDSKTGLVLTPTHITDFFCDIGEITKDDIVFDPCCGTGGFLVSAMNRMLELSGNDLQRRTHIKSNQLIGIERRPDMFSHACSNMMMRGDGKSHIYFGDCFSQDIKEKVQADKPTKTFLNPPYDVGADGQLEFIENAMDVIEANGLCVAICQMSTCTDTKAKTVAVKERLLEKHTLEAVLSMPDDLFYPVGVITSILVLRAHKPHNEAKKTFFGYFKDDGFLKVKNQGRIDQKERWADIRQKFLSVYTNRESIAGLSVTQVVKTDDEWCAEAYMETDYSTITDVDFIKTMKDYVAFQFLQG